MALEHLTLESFKKKIFDFEQSQSWNFNGNIPAVIDFYADWCGPCKMVAPILEDLAQEYQGQVEIFKVDTEQEQELASLFAIRSIPSILFIPLEGKPSMVQGALPKASFKQAFEEILHIAKD